MLLSLEIVESTDSSYVISMPILPNMSSLMLMDHRTIIIIEIIIASYHQHRTATQIQINISTLPLMQDTIITIILPLTIEELSIFQSNTDQATVVHDNLPHHQTMI